MSIPSTAVGDFRTRLRSNAPLIGTFVKTPTTHATEILASLGYDFVIVDAEHAPFDRRDIDLIAMAARLSGIAALVRVPEGTPAAILSCLDVGAAGVLVPHVDSPGRARGSARPAVTATAARAGYSTNSRAGNWGGTTMAAHMAGEDARVSCVAMIEDAAALERIDEIAATPGIDAFFIGRADLSSSLGQNRTDAPETAAAVDRIIAAARKADVTVMVLAASPKDAAELRDKGASAVVASNDQSFLRSAAGDVLKAYAPST